MLRIIPSWPAPPHIHAFTTTCELGNFADTQNRPQLQQQMFLSYSELACGQSNPSQIAWLKQVHSNNIVAKNDCNDASSQVHADGIWTQEDNEICAILTADCLPVLLVERTGKCMMALHAGWRGLFDNIVSKGIAMMGVPPESLLVWFGPVISARAYRVDDAFRTRFLQKNPNYIQAFHATNDLQAMTGESAWFCDLKRIAALQCEESGVTSVYDDNWCTYQQPKLFYSYRRQGEVAGRMATVIWRAARN